MFQTPKGTGKMSYGKNSTIFLKMSRLEHNSSYYVPGQGKNRICVNIVRQKKVINYSNASLLNS